MKSAPLFGNEFKFLRTHCNVSQEAVANAIEIADEDVFGIEERIDKPLDNWGTDMLFRVYISNLVGDEILAQTINGNLRALGRKTPVAERIIMRKADEWNSEVLSY
jgi:DNA-binding XRE family transcriptional regulator